MIRLKTGTWFAAFLGALVVCAGSAHATDIGGTISATVTITEDSQLVDDVTCTVTGGPCIAIGASNVTLDLNGFTITGQADPQVEFWHPASQQYQRQYEGRDYVQQLLLWCDLDRRF